MNNKRESVLFQCAGLLAVSLFLGLTYNAFSPKGIPLARKAPELVAVPDSVLFGVDNPIPAQPDTGSRVNNDSAAARRNVKVVEVPPSKPPVENPRKNEDGLQIITIAQMERILSRRQAVIIDARNPDEFDRGHFTGARNIPFTQIENHFEALLEIPRDTMVVVYCSDPDCPLGRELVKFMEQMEFKELLLFDAGWDGWVAAGKGGK